MRRGIPFALALLALALACGSADRDVGAVDLDARGAAALMARTPDLLVVDVRTPEEFAQGHLRGAVNVDFRGADFEGRLGTLERDRPVLLYCRTGNRSGKSLPAFARLGFRQVYHLAGGIVQWREAGQPLEGESPPAQGESPPLASQGQ